MSLNLAELLDDWDARILQYADPKTSYPILLDGSKRISNVEYLLLSHENRFKYKNCLSSLINHPECDQEVYNNLKNCKEVFNLMPEAINSVYNPVIQDKIAQSVKSYIFQFFKVVEQVIDAELQVSAYNSLFLSGGALVGEINKNITYSEGFFLGQLKIKDYDFYFTDKVVANEFVSFLLNNFTPIDNIVPKGLSVKPTFDGLGIEGLVDSYCSGIFKFGKTEFTGGISQNAFTIRMPGTPDLQFIIKHIGDPQFVVSNFDFLHSTHFMTLSDNKISFNKRGILSIRRASLEYSPGKKSLSSFFRMQYYITQGWKISKYESMKILFNLLGADLTDKDFLIANLSGMYREKAIKALEKYKDVKKLDSNQVLEIIKIFDNNENPAVNFDTEDVPF